MNDPGLDEPININAKDVEQEAEGEEEEEDDFLAPSRWWFASTAAPLIAGTFGPMTNAFNLLALIQPWRVQIIPGAAEAAQIDIPDPKWLIGINAVSLVAALVANIALLLNMARRLSFSIAQPVTIIGWYLSSILLIGLLATVPTHIRGPEVPPHVLSQAVYYAIISSILYFIIASLMTITVWGAVKGRYSKEFKLTTSQRTLMLQTISFLVYLFAGAAVYAHIENWRYLDAIYWADVTLLTVGLGDFAPTSHLGRSLLFPFAIGGILIIGLVIGSIRSLVLERGKKKMGVRMVEKTRKRALKKLNTEEGSIKILPFKKRHLVIEGATEKDRRQREFEVMREIQDQAEFVRRWTALAISSTVWLTLWLVGAVVFWRAEAPGQGWSYFQAVYFSYVSLLTLGYGDYRPQSNGAKPFFVFWSLLAVPTLTVLISNMGDTVVKYVRDLTLWVGSWTVLPDDVGVRGAIKQAASQIRKGNSKGDTFQEANPPGFMPKEKPGQGGREGSSQGKTHAVDRVAEEFEAEELSEGEEAARRGDFNTSNKKYYHYLLMREIKRVLPMVNETPPNKFSYEEWCWFLKLIGEDESTRHNHRILVHKESEGERGQAGLTEGRGHGTNLADGQQERNADGQIKDAHNPDRNKTHDIEPWSWIGPKSPLMGNKDEPEWVLERLSATLERELKEERGKKRTQRRRGRGSGDAAEGSSYSSSGRETSGEMRRREGGQNEG
ncbi:MAG: Potassium channel [Caeruleum heppii]|nr:MAG: Potassium channel [Caeruleum heppii]